MYSVGVTIDNGRSTATAAPNLWIKGKILLWPPGIPNRRSPSIPEPGWTEHPFKILRDSIETLEEALEIEEKFSKHLDSDGFKEKQKRKQIRREHPVAHVKRLKQVRNVRPKVDTNLKAARKAAKDDKSNETQKIDERRSKQKTVQQKAKKFHLNCFENEGNYLNAGIKQLTKSSKRNPTDPIVTNTYQTSKKRTEPTSTITQAQYLEKMKNHKELCGGERIRAPDNVSPQDNSEPYDMNKHRENLMKFLENCQRQAALNMNDNSKGEQNKPQNDNIRINPCGSLISPNKNEETFQNEDLTLNTFTGQFVKAPMEKEPKNDNVRHSPSFSPFVPNEVEEISRSENTLGNHCRNRIAHGVGISQCKDLTVDGLAGQFVKAAIQPELQNYIIRNNARIDASNPKDVSYYEMAGASNEEILNNGAPAQVYSSIESIQKSNVNECRALAEDSIDHFVNGVKEEQDLRSVLDSWALGHISNLVEEYDLELEEFLSLTDDHLKEIFGSNKESLAMRVKLRSKIDCHKNLRSNFEKKMDGSSSNSSNVNVAAIFYGNARINEIKKYFGTHKTLSEKYQTEMMDIILYYVFGNLQLLSTKQIQNVANQIYEIFPSESNIYYIPATSDTSTGGKFFHRYHNKLKMFRNQNKIPKSTRYMNKMLKESNSDETDESHLKYGLDWEQLSNENAFSLITDNFERVHGVEISECLHKTWSIIFDRRTIRKIVNAVKDTHTKDLLNEIPLSSESSKNAIVALSLHAILIPTNRSTNKKLWRATITTSQECFMCHVNIEAEIEKLLADRRKDCHDRNIELHPIIFAIGETINEITHFKVVFDHLECNFGEFTTAVDFCMKMYFTLGIPFPPECDQFYVALNKIFYKIDIPAKMSTKLTIFLDDLLKL